MRSSRHFKTISQILILAMLHLCWLTSYGYAEMIPTESAAQSQVETDRQRILDQLDRQEVIDELEKYGITKVEAVARINSLTNEEVTETAGKLDELEAGAGGDIFGWLVIIVYLFVVIIRSISCLFFGLTGIDEEFSNKCGLGYILTPLGEEVAYSTTSTARDQCLNSCYSDFNSCVEEIDMEGAFLRKEEEQCKEKIQMCVQECENEAEKEKLIKEECDPGMESCD